MRVALAWGSNSAGQCGTGEPDDLQSPSQVRTPAGHEPIAVEAGSEHSAIIAASGALLTWGSNEHGQLGLGEDTAGRAAVVAVPCVVAALSGTPICAVACGSRHTLALSVAGAVYAWGSGAFGALGLGGDVRDERPLPMLVPAMRSPATQVACGTHHSLALTESGALLAWGWGQHGQLGDGAKGGYAFSPRAVGGLERCRVTAIASGDTCQAPSTPCPLL